ncbi:MAG: metallophosphoesterase [Chloroflexi bacterium AL-W]|nr:metallophosphoesterase [Chloroflexi bacterium AL-N1]NOK67343.1 metallophosphoesterase [Chloroflexi bacterium AL-N10]NOK75165.1 metallophosphoesterase [Chloroflexi bacterium AL-N5]NOK81953.1 metallophosphoesterase [Chloroflexi bacterium AL-W]NOK89798.1 metallophosphoesterase [Chloroflexi bacterium AL-N15]
MNIRGLKPMKLMALTDIHEDPSHLAHIADQLVAVDLIVLAGDLTNATGTIGATAVINALHQYNQHILAVPGNWDNDATAAYLDDEGINLDNRHIIIEGVAFAGAGGSLRSIVPTPNEYTEEELATTLDKVISGCNPTLPLVLVCHQPPINTHNDLTWTQLHVGSHAVRTFIENVQPIICFTGHIHEGVGIDMIGQTQVVNPGLLFNGGYAYAEIAPSHMHVECRHI